MAKKKPAGKKAAAKKPKKPASSPSAPEAERICKFSDESVAAALRAAGGLVYAAAKMLRCTTHTVYNHVKANPALKEILREERGLTVDESMTGLRAAVKDREAWAIRFTLETLGKSRGFVTRTESRIGGDKKAGPIKTESQISFDDLPLDLRIAILDYAEKKEATDGIQTTEAGSIPAASESVLQ